MPIKRKKGIKRTNSTLPPPSTYGRKKGGKNRDIVHTNQISYNPATNRPDSVLENMSNELSYRVGLSLAALVQATAENTAGSDPTLALGGGALPSSVWQPEIAQFLGNAIYDKYDNRHVVVVGGITGSVNPLWGDDFEPGFIGKRTMDGTVQWMQITGLDSESPALPPASQPIAVSVVEHSTERKMRI